MNSRIAPQDSERSIRTALREISHYPKMVRFRAPEGVQLYSGRLNGVALRCEGQTPSLLCIHGYCGGPEEVRIGFEVARSLGLAASAPVLRGHGGSPEELSHYRFADWLDDVRHEFERLRKRGPVLLLGMSMGSLLAAELALDAPEAVAGLVVLSNAFWIKNPMPGALLSAARFLRLPDFGYPTRDLTVSQGSTTRRYHVQPVRAAISVVQAGRRLRRELHRITCPTLVLHGAEDEVCAVSNAWRFASLLGSSKKRVVVLPGARHVFSLDGEQEALRDEIRGFLEPCAASRVS